MATTQNRQIPIFFGAISVSVVSVGHTNIKIINHNVANPENRSPDTPRHTME